MATKRSAPPLMGVEVVRTILDQITDKWSILILIALCDGPARFNAIRRQLTGITQKALTQALRRLERNGLIARKVIPVSPVAVEYSITELGRILEGPYTALYNCVSEHQLAIRKAQANFDRSYDKY